MEIDENEQQAAIETGEEKPGQQLAAYGSRQLSRQARGRAAAGSLWQQAAIETGEENGSSRRRKTEERLSKRGWRRIKHQTSFTRP